MKKCELCDSPTKMYCESDQASLCWDCDTRVHGANFLVAKHTRTLLCHICQAPTPWNGSGPKLGPTISVCSVCVGTTNTSCSREQHRNNEHELDRQDGHDHHHHHHHDNEQEDDDNDDDDSGDDDSGDDDGGEDEEHADDDDDDDEENQVVPWTSTPPPPVSSSSTSTEEGSSRWRNGEEGTSASNLTFYMNHMRETTITKFGSQDHRQQRYYSSGCQQHKNMYWSHESPSNYR